MYVFVRICDLALIERWQRVEDKLENVYLTPRVFTLVLISVSACLFLSLQSDWLFAGLPTYPTTSDKVAFSSRTFTLSNSRLNYC